MGDVVSFFEDTLGSAWDFIEQAVEDAWEQVAAPLIEDVLGIFGIVDEDVLIVQKISTPIYYDEDSEVDVIHQTNIKSVISMTQTGRSFYDWYTYYTSLPQSQLKGYYRYGENQYIHNLPNMEVRGGDIDFDAIDDALNDALGFSATRLTSNTGYPSDEVYIKNELQASPYLYKPWDNTLTFGGDSTWTITSIVYNPGPDNYTVNISHATLPDDTITEPGFVKERTLTVTYHADTDPSTEWFYWLYVLSDGTYPIDPQASVITRLEMLPVAILRRDGEDITVDKTTSEYRTTKRLLSTIDISAEEILTNAAKNEWYDDVQDLYVNFSVCPVSTAEIASKALWLTFHEIIVVNNVLSGTDEYIATFDEQDVNNALVWTNHYYSSSRIGAMGAIEYDHEIVNIEEDPEADPPVEASSELRIRHRTAALTHELIVIENLNGMSAIKKDGFHSMHLNTLGDEDLTIPVSMFILNKLSQQEIMQLYEHMFRLDIYAAEIIHLEYYQTKTFSNYFELAMLVITAWTLGAATGPIQILKALLTQFLIMHLVVYLAELTGNAEFAAVVGLVAAIGLGYAAGGTFSFQSADELLKVSTQFADNLTVGYNTLSEGIQDDLVALNEMAEGRLQELEDVAPDRGPVTAEFLVALQSVDTTVYPAIKAQYNFDLLYNYDRLIADYYNINLNTGVT